MQIRSQELARLLAIILVALVVCCCCSSIEQEQVPDEPLTGPPDARRTEWRTTTWVRASKQFVKNRLLPFSDFKRKFHKIYISQSEETLRHALYTDRLIKAAITFKKYVNKQLTTYRSVNARSDMTEKERALLLARRPKRLVTEDIEHDVLTSMAQDKLGVTSPAGNDAAISYLSSWFAKRKQRVPQVYREADLRDTKCLFPTGDQGTCSSCASFVAIAQLEYLRCRETGTLEKFSEQFTLDCGEPFGMMGCSGTSVHSLFRFIAQVGLESGDKYPYVGHKRRCPYYNRVKRSYGFESADTLKLKNEGITGALLSQWSLLLEKKIPLHIGLKVDEDFEDYGGGVAGSCNPKNGAHGMLLVGEGRQNGVDYWLLRNSYGKDWGQDGHYKMSKQATGCFSDDGLGYYPVAFTRTFGNSFIRN